MAKRSGSSQSIPKPVMELPKVKELPLVEPKVADKARVSVTTHGHFTPSTWLITCPVNYEALCKSIFDSSRSPRS